MSITANDIQTTAARIRDNVSRVIVGKDAVIELMLVTLFCEGHVLLEDVPGIGKTTMAKALATSLGCDFSRIQFTPDLLPTDITGVSIFSQKSEEFEYRPGPIMSQIVLADEINRAGPRTQSALLEAMQERQVTVDGVTRPLSRPFMVLATQNPIELEGTFPLPEAQVDRFLMRIDVGYPTSDEERQILRRFRTSDPLITLEAVTKEEEILAVAEQVREIAVSDAVEAYIVSLVRASRDNESLDLGVSPRGTLALYRTSQALAAIRGRNYVQPDDVQYLAEPTLAHRLILSAEARLRDRTDVDVLEDILNKVPVPVEESWSVRDEA
jgi:MoxR-like ATPase